MTMFSSKKKDEYYYLMNKNNKVLKFNTTKNIISGYKIVEIYNEDILPFAIKYNLNGFTSWIEERPIATNQEHLHAVLSSLAMERRDAITLLKVNGGFSLNDSYWIKACDSNEYNIVENWETGNLYVGDWDNSLGLISFFGNTSSLGGTLKTPEITNQGSVGKAWRNIHGELYLYKKSSEGGANLGKEHFAEVIASNLAKLLELKHVEYWQDSWHDKTCCVSKLFTDSDIGYLPMYQVLQGKGINRDSLNYELLLSALKNKEDILKFKDLIVFDFIIENWDRHLSNFGVLINNNTQKVLELAPIFDNGYSLMSRDMVSDFETRDYSNYTRNNASLSISNRDLAHYVISENKQRYKHWAKVIITKLNGLLIPNCPQWYMDATLKLIYLRCKEIQQL